MAADFKRERTGGETGISKDGATASAVWTVTGVTNESAVLKDSGIPVRYNAPYLDDLSSELRCDRIRAIAVSPNFFRLVASYSIPTSGGQHTGTTDNPLNQPTTFRWNPVKMSLQIDRDIFNNPIIASSGRGFDPPAYKTFSTKELVVTRTEPSFSLPTALAYENTVNAGVFSGAKAGEVMCTDISPVTEFTTVSSYVRVAYTFLFMSETVFGEQPHQLRVKDQDTMAWALVQPADGFGNTVQEPRLVRLCSGDGIPVDTPVLLGANGTPINDTVTYLNANGEPVDGPTWVNVGRPTGSTWEDVPGGTAAFLRYQTYPTSNFNALGLSV